MDTTWQRRQELSLHPATATAAETEDWHGRSMQSDKGYSAQVRTKYKRAGRAIYIYTYLQTYLQLLSVKRYNRYIERVRVMFGL